ncbi:MAG: hypothetical protein SGARI_000148, partial [Bacillariaceae sp.]
SCVTIVGLTKRPDLNGAPGVVLGFDDKASGSEGAIRRVKVCVFQELQRNINVLVKPDNLQRPDLVSKRLRYAAHQQVDGDASTMEQVIQCLQMDPLCVLGMSKLSHLYVQQANLPMALKWQKRAVANSFAGYGFYSDDDRVDNVLELSTIYDNMGDKETAGQVLERARAMAPEGHRGVQFDWGIHQLSLGNVEVGVQILEDLVHKPYRTAQEIQYKTMAQKHVVELLLRLTDEGNLLDSDGSEEKYQMALNYANRILRIPRIETNSKHVARGLANRALATALLWYSDSGTDQESSDGVVADLEMDVWKEIKGYLDQCLDLYRAHQQAGPDEHSIEIPNQVLEYASRAWALRGDYLDRMSVKNNAKVSSDELQHYAKQCHAESERLRNVFERSINLDLNREEDNSEENKSQFFFANRHDGFDKVKKSLGIDDEE